MMSFVVPLSATVSEGDAQFAVARFVFCCRSNPVEGEGQETTTVFVVVRVMVSNGAPGVGTAVMLQKPPLIVDESPVRLPASGWPMVPRTAKTPPVLVPPPPSIVDQEDTRRNATIVPRNVWFNWSGEPTK